MAVKALMSVAILVLISRQASSARRKNTRRLTRVTRNVCKEKLSSKFVFGFILRLRRIIRLTDNSNYPSDG